MYIHEIEWPILIFSTPSLRFQYVYLDQHTYILVWNENKKKRTEITINIKWKTDNIAAQKKAQFLYPYNSTYRKKLINFVALFNFSIYGDDYTNSNRFEFLSSYTLYLYSQRT